MTLPSSVEDWMLLFCHCIGGAIFVTSVRIAQQMASLMTVSLALGFHIVWYLIGQELFFFERSSALGLIVEVTGSALVIVSAILDPLHKVSLYCQGKKNVGQF